MIPTRRHQRRRAMLRRALRGLGVAALALAVGGFATVMALLAVWPPVDRVVTGETPEYPDVQPRAYAFSRDRVVAAVVEAATRLPRFEPTSVDEAAGIIRLRAASVWLAPEGRLEVRVEPNGAGGAIVFAEAWTDEGTVEFGQNARNLGELYEGIESRLGLR